MVSSPPYVRSPERNTRHFTSLTCVTNELFPLEMNSFGFSKDVVIGLIIQVFAVVMPRVVAMDPAKSFQAADFIRLDRQRQADG